jgi:hypothetical protein
MLNVDYLCYTRQVCQLTKKSLINKTYGLLPTKITESDIVTLGHELCQSDGTTSIYNKDNIQNTLSAFNHNDRSSHKSQTCLILPKPQIRQQCPSRDCFKTTGWHITHNLNLLTLTMGNVLWH